MSDVFFKPWVGVKYASGARFGKRVMVLGESHYEWDPKVKLYPEFTRAAIEEQAAGKHTYAFWTHVATAFLGHSPTLAEKREFWDAVAFYNFVQQVVDGGPRVAPSDAMWKASEGAFAEV